MRLRAPECSCVGVHRACHPRHVDRGLGTHAGSIYISWAARMAPALIASAVFIDPIVFMLHQPKVAHEFLYRPKTSDSIAFMEKYFVQSERRIVSYFHRQFYWCRDCAEKDVPRLCRGCAEAVPRLCRDPSLENDPSSARRSRRVRRRAAS